MVKRLQQKQRVAILRALAQGARVHVLTRSADAQRLALDLGADAAGPADAGPPEALDAAITFAPAG